MLVYLSHNVFCILSDLQVKELCYFSDLILDIDYSDNILCTMTAFVVSTYMYHCVSQFVSA